MLLPLLGLLVGVLAGSSSTSTSASSSAGYSAVAILAALDSVLGAVRAELDGVYDNRIFVSGFLVNAISPCSSPSSATGSAWICTW